MTAGVIARGCYLSRLRAAGAAGLSRSELARVAVPGLGPLRAADRDELLGLLERMRLVERFEHRPLSGPPALCWRATRGGTAR